MPCVSDPLQIEDLIDYKNVSLLCKMAVDERFMKCLCLGNVIKAFFNDVFLNFFKIFDVFVVSKLVHVHSMSFVAPESDNV